jgi:hypothetical protein
LEKEKNNELNGFILIKQHYKKETIITKVNE